MNSQKQKSSPSHNNHPENRYYCYLIRSLAKPNSKTTYIGFTTNPTKRIRQHNGEITCGAFKTIRLRPWQFICVVGGFPNKYVALQFEWQWQCNQKSRFHRLIHPEKHLTQTNPGDPELLNADPQIKSKKRKIKDSTTDLPAEEAINSSSMIVPRKQKPRKSGSSSYQAKLTVLQELLHFPLWKQLNLMVYFLDESLQPIAERLFYSKLAPSKSFRFSFITLEALHALDTMQSGRTAHLNNNSSLEDSSVCCVCSQPLSLSCGNQALSNSVKVRGRRGKRKLDSEHDTLLSPSSLPTSQAVVEGGGIPRRFWGCPQCARAQHLSCTARAQSTLVDDESNDLIPARGKCGHCHHQLPWIELVADHLILSVSPAGVTRSNISSSQLPDNRDALDDDEDEDDNCRNSVDEDEEESDASEVDEANDLEEVGVVLEPPNSGRLVRHKPSPLPIKSPFPLESPLEVVDAADGPSNPFDDPFFYYDHDQDFGCAYLD